MAALIPVNDEAMAMHYVAYKRAVWRALVEFWTDLADRRPEWAAHCHERLIHCRAGLAEWEAA